MEWFIFSLKNMKVKKASLNHLKTLRVFVAFCLILTLESVQACMVCGTANPQARYAFFWTAALLTIVPLVMIGFGAYYLSQKSKAMKQADSEK